MHEGPPAGVGQSCLPSSGLASTEHPIIEAAIQLPLAQDSRDVDLGGVGIVWRDEVHLANLLAKGGVSLSAERLGPPLQGSLLGDLCIELLEEVGVVGGPVLGSDAGGALQLVDRHLGQSAGSGSQHGVKSRIVS